MATAAEAPKTIYMERFQIELPAILDMINDCLFPSGIADIEKDDFAAVLAALKRQG